MLHVKNICIKYPNHNDWILKNINLELNSGETIWLKGKNGIGKSTLLYSICNVIPQLINAIRTGYNFINGEVINDIPINSLIPNLSLMQANPHWEMFFTNLIDEITFPLENIGLSDKIINERLEYVTSLLGIGSIMNQPSVNLSFGWQKMAAIAVHAAMKPKILLLDEPFNGLSVNNIKSVLNWMTDFTNCEGSIIVTDHTTTIKEINPKILYL